MGAELSLDAIDLSILFLPKPSLKSAAALRREIADTGMRVAMLTSYPDFTHPSAQQRQVELAREQEVIAIAAELGAELVRVTAGQAHPQTRRQQGIAWAVEGLSNLVETTRDCGVRLVYENHAKPGAWTYTDFSQPPDIFLEIARLTEATGLGINFDTGNASAFVANPLELLEQVLPRVVSVHAADTASYGALRHVLLGTGITPFVPLFKCLRQAGWDGWVCMEEASNQGQAGVEAAARFIRQAWRQSEG
jgi:sugar phosphate isomerase/epimerase